MHITPYSPDQCTHRLDQVLLDQLLDGSAGQRSVDVQTVCQDRGGDHLVLGHLVDQLVVGILVEEDQVVNLRVDGRGRKGGLATGGCWVGATSVACFLAVLLLVLVNERT